MGVCQNQTYKHKLIMSPLQSGKGYRDIYVYRQRNRISRKVFVVIVDDVIVVVVVVVVVVVAVVVCFVFVFKFRISLLSSNAPVK